MPEKKVKILDMPLLPKEIEYCKLRVCGFMGKYRAHMRAFGTSEASAKVQAAQLEMDPRIKELMKELMNRKSDELFLSYEQKRRLLALRILTPLEEIDEKSPLCDSVSYRYNKDGKEIGKTIKVMSLDTAIKLDNEMAGHNAPQEIKVENSGGVMLVPIGAGETLEEFEKKAIEQQKKLKGGWHKQETCFMFNSSWNKKLKTSC